MTPLQQLKKHLHSKRFFVIAQQYSELKVSSFGENRELLERTYKGQYKFKRDSMFEYEFGTALCAVSKNGIISWGLFEKQEIK